MYLSRLLTAVFVGLVISFAQKRKMKRAEMADLEMHGVQQVHSLRSTGACV